MAGNLRCTTLLRIRDTDVMHKLRTNNLLVHWHIYISAAFRQGLGIRGRVDVPRYRETPAANPESLDLSVAATMLASHAPCLVECSNSSRPLLRGIYPVSGTLTTIWPLLDA